MSDRRDPDDERRREPDGLGGPLTRARMLRRTAGAGVAAAAVAGSAYARPAARESARTAEVRRGGVLRLAVTDATRTEKLDPALSFTTNDSLYCGQIYECLTATDENWNVRPLLATRWRANANATQWTFTLRRGVRFHDGSLLTADDVVWSLRRLLVKELGSSMYSRLQPSLDRDGIRATGDHTVVLRLKRADALLPVALALRGAKIVKNGTREFTPRTAIGTGPFRLASWSPGQSWSLEAHEAYWQRGVPYLEGVQAVVVPDQSTKMQSVSSGGSHVGDAIEHSSISSARANRNVAVQLLANRQSFVFVFNRTVRPFDDVRVVQAIRAAQDRRAILRAVLQGVGSVTADVPAPSTSPFYPRGLSTRQDIPRARRLLRQAGLPDGLEIELSTSAVAAGIVEMAQALQQVVKPAGIEIRLRQHPPAAYWDNAWMKTPAFQDYFNHRHPVDTLALFYASDAAWNEPQYKDAVLDGLIRRAFGAVDVREQRTLVRQAFVRAATRGGYAIPVFAPQAWVRKRDVRGLRLNYTDYAAFDRVWLA